MLKLFCLGTLRLEVDAVPITLTPKANALLLYLAVTQRAHSRDRLADLLWSDTNNQQARDNLRYLLPELRRPLRDYLVITPREIAFNQQAPYWVDVGQLREALTGPPDASATPPLQAALDLYQGEFLAGFTVRNAPVFEAWMVQQREELHTLVVQGGYTLAERYWQQGDYQNGLAATQRLLQWEPWHEAGHRLQMQLLVATGQRTAALAHYDRCRAILAEELGVAPEAATTALYAQLRDGKLPEQKTGRQEDKAVVLTEGSLSPPLPVPASSSLPHNLPNQPTPFIGRTTEIDQLCALLAEPTHRLITLTGLGGVGKTRLALAVGQRILDFGFSIFDSVEPSSPHDENPKSKIQSLSWKDPKFPDGVWFIPLITLVDGENLSDQLALAVLAALHVPLAGPIAPTQQLLDVLHKRRLLLILDNFEHLPGGIDFLLTLLRRTQSVQMLVTSRHLLDLQAEVVYSLAGLATPALPVALAMPTADALHYDSVALFVERAQRADRTFQLTPANQVTVLAICHFVEGLPLGIELAAALLRYLTAAELWQTLRQDYRALAFPQRDRPVRQQSITALFDYSWQHLTPAQAQTLAACALFPQSFTAEAAAAIAGATTATLFALVDRSLLRRTARGRFDLHELVRQYAAEQCQRDPQAVTQWRHRHAHYYASFIEPDGAALFRSSTQLPWIQQELPNLRLAWLWAIEQQQLWPITQINQGFFVHFLMQGPIREGWELFRLAIELIQRLPPGADAVLEAQILAEQGYFTLQMGHYDKVAPLAHAAIAIAQPVSEANALVFAYMTLGMLAFMRNNFAEQESYFQQALDAAQAGSQPLLTVVVLLNWAVGLPEQGRVTEAQTKLQQALQLAQEQHFIYLESDLLNELSAVYALLGDWALAIRTTQQAFARAQALNSSIDWVGQYRRLAVAAAALGDYTGAIAWTDKALAFSAFTPALLHQLEVLLVRGRALRHLGKLPEAEAACQQLLTLAQSLGRPLESAQAQLELGHIALDGQVWQAAAEHYRAVLATSAAPTTAAAQAGLAWLAYQQQHLAAAQPWLEQACATLRTQPLATQYDVAHTALTCYWLLAVAQDPRVASLLAYAWAWLETQALKISDDALRQAFLQNVPAHRQLQELAQEVVK